jgi:aminoglycoside phosphotransferase (APT) family kinase protein
METQLAEWLSATLGRSVHRVRSLSFGITSELDLIEAEGELFVLRRYKDADEVARHPDRVVEELHALEAASAVFGDFVPRPIAFDRTGIVAGDPALLMTYVGGRPVIHDLDAALLVEPLARLHHAEADVRLPQYRHWFDLDRVRTPAWTSSPAAWRTLTDLVATPEPVVPVVFLHRDYHPGNLLWDGGRMSGIVDWVAACRGPAAADVAHTRCNLMLIDGSDAANRFLTEYKKTDPSYDHHPWWDAAELLTWDDDFAGVMAFNAFGAGLEVDLLRTRADAFAEMVAASAREAE